MTPFALRSRHFQRGVSLIEIMVGLTVGLLVVLAAIGTLQFMELQRRSSASLTSQLANASISMVALEREVELAGAGMMNTSSAAQQVLCATAGSIQAWGDPLPAVLQTALSVTPLQVINDATTGVRMDIVYAESPSVVAPFQVVASAAAASPSQQVVFVNPPFLAPVGSQTVDRFPGGLAEAQVVVARDGAGQCAVGRIVEAPTLDASSGAARLVIEPFVAGATAAPAQDSMFRDGAQIQQIGRVVARRIERDAATNRLLMSDPLDADGGVAVVLQDNVTALSMELGLAANAAAQAVSSWSAPSSAGLAAADLERLRAIRVTLTVASEDRQAQPRQLQTILFPRNMSLGREPPAGG